MALFKPGTEAPKTGQYWCSVCKWPAQFQAGQVLPTCKNKCGRGQWELVRELSPAEKEAPPSPG